MFESTLGGIGGSTTVSGSDNNESKFELKGRRSNARISILQPAFIEPLSNSQSWLSSLQVSLQFLLGLRICLNSETLISEEDMVWICKPVVKCMPELFVQLWPREDSYAND